jgi:hypothetical protein
MKEETMSFKSIFAMTIALMMTMMVPIANAQNKSVDAPVRALIAAMSAENAAAIRAQFSSSATQAYGADGKMKSAAATARWLETDIISLKGKVTNPTFSVSGNQVTVRGQYTNSRGYASTANFLFTVNNGLITSWRMRY